MAAAAARLAGHWDDGCRWVWTGPHPPDTPNAHLILNGSAVVQGIRGGDGAGRRLCRRRPTRRITRRIICARRRRRGVRFGRRRMVGAHRARPDREDIGGYSRITTRPSAINFAPLTKTPGGGSLRPRSSTDPVAARRRQRRSDRRHRRRRGCARPACPGDRVRRLRSCAGVDGLEERRRRALDEVLNDRRPAADALARNFAGGAGDFAETAKESSIRSSSSTYQSSSSSSSSRSAVRRRHRRRPPRARGRRRPPRLVVGRRRACVSTPLRPSAAS